MMRFLIALLLLPLLATHALAVNPDEVLDDPVLEQRAREISVELRCLVCQNQSIDDSDADLARDLRLLVRERLVEGDTDQQVLDYIVARYGEYVLLNPVLAWHTLLLWGAAPLAMLCAVLLLVLRGRRRPSSTGPSAEMTEDEKLALNSIRSDSR